MEYVDSVDSSERYEQLIAFLDSQLPRPVEQQAGDDQGQTPYRAHDTPAHSNVRSEEFAHENP